MCAPECRSRALAGLAALALASTVTLAEPPAAPRTYRVSGIGDGSVLNVRAAPSGSAADLGDLGAGAAPLEILEVDGSGAWGRILWREGNAWVALRYLAPVDLPRVAGTSLPAGLRCAGTEPFWSAALTVAGELHLDLLGAGSPRDADVVDHAESRNGLHFPVALEARDASAHYTLLVRPAQCSDGMSERLYGWAADLLWRRADGVSLLSGCCGLPLRD